MTANGPVTSAQGETISIVDPIAGFSYSLDPEHKIAWKTPAGGAGAIMGKLEASQVEATLKQLKEKLATVQQNADQRNSRRDSRAEDEKRRPDTRRRRRVAAALRPALAGWCDDGRQGLPWAPDTPLEHKTIEGVAVDGRKTTVTIPAGQVGNEQPITITSEERRSRAQSPRADEMLRPADGRVQLSPAEHHPRRARPLPLHGPAGL